MTDETIQGVSTPVDPTQTTPAPSLALSDLVLTLQTLQVCAQRGAIRADELSSVGGLHDRLFAFLEAQGVITRQTVAPVDTTSTPAGTSDA
jgi:hypothetical protein